MYVISEQCFFIHLSQLWSGMRKAINYGNNSANVFFVVLIYFTDVEVNILQVPTCRYDTVLKHK
jgi:hypothetical protein